MKKKKVWNHHLGYIQNPTKCKGAKGISDHSQDFPSHPKGNYDTIRHPKMAPPYPNILPTTMWPKKPALDRLDRLWLRPLVEAHNWIPKDDDSDVSGRLRRPATRPALDYG